ncbi:GPN-loop GTPase 3 [Cucumispora dikerogammari]|nr:GPN-loop GTPase 3 [Cucumispora dikerogammari]
MPKTSTCIFVIGPAGSGKTTLISELCNLSDNNLQNNKDNFSTNFVAINFDPASFFPVPVVDDTTNQAGPRPATQAGSNTSTQPSGNKAHGTLQTKACNQQDLYILDIRSYIDIDTIMLDYDLGPNNALLKCYEFFVSDPDLLSAFVEDLDYTIHDYNTNILVDCPGQLEIYLHSKSFIQLLNIFEKKYKIVIIFVNDSTDNERKYICNTINSVLISSRLWYPFINVTSKWDIIDDMDEFSDKEETDSNSMGSYKETDSNSMGSYKETDSNSMGSYKETDSNSMGSYKETDSNSMGSYKETDSNSMGSYKETDSNSMGSYKETDTLSVGHKITKNSNLDEKVSITCPAPLHSDNIISQQKLRDTLNDFGYINPLLAINPASLDKLGKIFYNFLTHYNTDSIPVMRGDLDLLIRLVMEIERVSGANDDD